DLAALAEPPVGLGDDAAGDAQLGGERPGGGHPRPGGHPAVGDGAAQPLGQPSGQAAAGRLCRVELEEVGARPATAGAVPLRSTALRLVHGPTVTAPPAGSPEGNASAEPTPRPPSGRTTRRPGAAPRWSPAAAASRGSARIRPGRGS